MTASIEKCSIRTAETVPSRREESLTLFAGATSAAAGNYFSALLSEMIYYEVFWSCCGAEYKSARSSFPLNQAALKFGAKNPSLRVFFSRAHDITKQTPKRL
jgi:hypothetical protein